MDNKVGFWIRGVPYIWRRLDGGRGNPANWKDWQRVYIFREDKIGNLLPEKCPDDVREYFNFISRSQFDYEFRSPDFDYYGSVIRIEGKDIDPLKVPVILLFNYKGKKLLNRIVKNKSEIPLDQPLIEEEIEIPIGEANLGVLLAKPRVPESPERGEPTILTDYFKEWYMWASIWYIDQIMGKNKNVCLLVDPNIIHIGIEMKQLSTGHVEFNPQVNIKNTLKLCLRNKNIEFIYSPLYETTRGDDQDSHAYLLLFDKRAKEIYLFDAIGWGIRWSYFEKDLLRYLGLDRTWKVKSLDWCPKYESGISHIQDEERMNYIIHTPEESRDKWAPESRLGDPVGFCVVWILWVVETLINNPDKHFEDVLKQAHKKMKDETPSYTRFIRRYAKSVIDYQRNSPKKNRKYIQHNLREYVEYLEKSK